MEKIVCCRCTVYTVWGCVLLIDNKTMTDWVINGFFVTNDWMRRQGNRCGLCRISDNKFRFIDAFWFEKQMKDREDAGDDNFRINCLSLIMVWFGWLSPHSFRFLFQCVSWFLTFWYWIAQHNEDQTISDCEVIPCCNEQCIPNMNVKKENRIYRPHRPFFPFECKTKRLEANSISI